MIEIVVSLAIPAAFVACLVLERVIPARRLPHVRFWLAKGVAFFLCIGVMNAVVPGILGEPLRRLAVLDLSPMGIVPGAIVALLAFELASYWVHRGVHRVDFLFRWIHQMHHSAERMDIAGATYFHPFEMTLGILLPMSVASLLGLPPESGMIAGFAQFLFAMFQHLNVKTPRWIGWVVQRPEAHSLHHGRGVHGFNYGNLVVWDMLFGTYRNPEGFTEVTGFWDGASTKTLPMLFGRDVTTPGEATRDASVRIAA